MNNLLEMKAKLIGLVERNEPLVKPLIKLIVMLTAFLTVYYNLGYYQKVHIFFFPLILAVICAVISWGAGVAVLGLYVLINLYGLGIEITMVAAALMLLCYLLFIRFAPNQSYWYVVSPLLWVLRIPYVAPVSIGLLFAPTNAVAILMGTVLYYFFKGVKQNEALFRSGEGATAFSKVTVALDQIVANKEMWVVLAAFFITTVVVYIIRRLSIKNAWNVAISVGVTLQLLLILLGKLMLGNTSGMIALIVGSVASMVISFVIEFFMFHLDYTRVERVQFEDDNYYYYVKAVPKVLVSAEEKRVTTFGNTKSDHLQKKEESMKDQIAKELEIDSSLLK